jgi:sec-independent protein translocase protein TatC
MQGNVARCPEVRGVEHGVRFTPIVVGRLEAAMDEREPVVEAQTPEVPGETASAGRDPGNDGAVAAAPAADGSVSASVQPDGGEGQAAGMAPVSARPVVAEGSPSAAGATLAASAASAAPAAGEEPPTVPLAVTPALRTVLAWSEIVGSEGEDDLEPYPLGPEPDEDAHDADGAVAEEPTHPDAPPLEVVEAEDAVGAGQEATARDTAAAAAGASAALVPAPSAPAAVAVSAAPAGAAGAGSGGGSGGGRGGVGGAAAGGARRPGRRRPLLDIVDRPMTIVEHLDELRRRLLWAVVAFIVGTGVTFAFIHQVLRFTERPFKHYHIVLQAISPMELLIAPVRLAALGGLLLGSPVIVYEIVMYILPALTRRERRILFSYLPATSLLFAAGLAFGYFVFEPVALHVAVDFLPGVLARPTLNNWVSFLIEYSVPFGLVFELPVVVVVLTRLGILSAATLAKQRRYAIFGAVVVGEIFSPPADFIFTPSLIALPIIALWEISVQAARIAERRRARDEAEEQEAWDAETGDDAS